MATITLNCTDAPNSSTFENSASLRITYTASNGTFKITEIEGRRTDGYRTYSLNAQKLSITVNGTTKSVSVSKIDFDSSYIKFSATDTSWTGITSNSFSITVKTSSGSLAHQSATFKTSSNVTMSWSTYTVTYNANGGIGAPASQTKTYGKTLTLSNTKPTRASIVEDDTTISYTFKGWTTSQSSETVEYVAGASYTKNASVTLYAVWTTETTINSYDVIYDTGTGIKIPTQEKIKGTALTLTATIPSKHGFTFDKWNTAEDGSGTSYNSGDSYTIDADILLYAIYTAWTHTVIYNANGGNVNSTPDNFVKTGGKEASISAVEPVREGYVFRYWNTAPDGSGITYYSGKEYDFDQNGNVVTLYAIWSLDSISMYLDNGKCKSIEFREGLDLLGFMKGSIVSAGEFVEGDILSIKHNIMYFTEIIEK